MKHLMMATAAAALALGGIHADVVVTAAQSCESLASLSLPTATITGGAGG